VKLADRPSIVAVLQGLLVTFLWSSSYVLVKIGLIDLSPFFFATVRYTIAFALLLLLLIVRGNAHFNYDGKQLVYLVVTGLMGYTFAQGLNFVGLSLLPAVSVSFLLNFTPLFVTLIEFVFLRVTISKIQIMGMLTSLFGAYIFFPVEFSMEELYGIIIVIVSGVAWASYMVLTRFYQSTQKFDSLIFTTSTMGVGSLGLMGLTLFFEGLQQLHASNFLIIVWLGLVNTAFAFFLWNHVLKSLKAYELSVLQNTMLVQIAVLSNFFLGEEITVRMLIGMAFVLIGVTMVQLRRIQQSE
jgi:drug/metabolite transporter (DMT)-like permease